MAKSLGYGFADKVQTKSEEEKASEDAAWAVAEMVQNVQAIYDKQIETYMTETHEMLEKLIVTVGNINKCNRQNGGPNHGCKCPHCKHHYPNTPGNKC